MKEIDLDKYKAAWKSEKGFDEKTLSKTEVQKFMQSESKNIQVLFKKGLKFDIVFKILLAISFCGLAVLFSAQSRTLTASIILAMATFIGIAFQISVYRKIRNEGLADQTTKILLQSYIGFYNKRYINSLFISALSSSLLFISGSLYYFYFKYGKIHSFQFDDYLVFGTAVVLSFLFGAFSQIKNFNFHVKQLTSCLFEIEQETLNQTSLLKYKKQKFRYLVIMGTAFIIGLLTLLYLIFRFVH